MRRPPSRDLARLLDQWLSAVVNCLWEGDNVAATCYWDCAFSLALELDLYAVDIDVKGSAWKWSNLTAWVAEARAGIDRA
jgi:hypothetical protein